MEGSNSLDRISKPKELSEKEKELLTLSKVGHRTQSIYFKGKRIGKISLRESGGGNSQSIYEVEIEPGYRNRGIGKEVYRRVNQELNKKGMVLTSEIGGITSTEANHMWESLVRSGEAEVVTDFLTERGVPVRYKFKDPK